MPKTVAPLQLAAAMDGERLSIRYPPQGFRVPTPLRLHLVDSGGKHSERDIPAISIDQVGQTAIYVLPDPSAAKDGHSVRRITILSLSDGTLSEISAQSPAFLSCLLPMDDAEARALIFDKRTRYSDLGALIYMLRQVIHRPTTSALWLVEAVKVYTYRALESGKEEDISESLPFIDLALDRCGEFSSEHGTGKRPRFHAMSSLLCLKALCCLALGDLNQYSKIMNVVRGLVPDVALTPTAANNIALALTIFAFIERKRGRPKSAKMTIRSVLQTFRLAANSYPTSSAKIFAELQVTYSAAIACVQMSTDASPFSEAGSDRYVAEKFLRLNGTAGEALILRRLLGIGAA